MNASVYAMQAPGTYTAWVDDRVVILDSCRGRYHILDARGAAVWRRLESPVLLHESASSADTDGASRSRDGIISELIDSGIARRYSGHPAGSSIISTWSIATRLVTTYAQVRRHGILGTLRWIDRWPPVLKPFIDDDRTSRDRARYLALRVSRVAAVIPLRLRCLEQALALYGLLRVVGIVADLQLGVCAQPFAAHCWVEVAGVPIAESPGVRDEYTLFEGLTW